jgi:DoxX-like protein
MDMGSRATKGTRYLYYVGVGLMGIFFIISGFLEITKNPATYPKTLRMGYPPYFIAALGCAKIVGSLALWLPNYFRRLKEWVFAGFTFDVIFAFISGLQIDSLADCLRAAVSFVFIVLIYWLFRTVSDARLRVAD